MINYWKKNISIVDQYARLRHDYPHFKVVINREYLKIKGQIQPSPRSLIYQFKINYKIGNRPQIKITNPELKKNFKNDRIPHVYSGNELCLYYPKYKEFTSKQPIVDYIIPWISLWLYYYEIWHATGEWLGGGFHPKIKE
jgi:hypothetical protein